MLNQLPSDPTLLLSVVNTKLRDYYDNIDVLCKEMGIAKEDLIHKMKTIDYEYDKEQNQFV